MQGHSQAESLRPRVALLADRDPDTRAMYAEFLKYLGWATLEAANGRDALATVVGQHPAVVILETHLAFIDGLELCRLSAATVTSRLSHAPPRAGDTARRCPWRLSSYHLRALAGLTHALSALENSLRLAL